MCDLNHKIKYICENSTVSKWSNLSTIRFQLEVPSFPTCVGQFSGSMVLLARLPAGDCRVSE